MPETPRPRVTATSPNKKMNIRMKHSWFLKKMMVSLCATSRSL